MVTYDLSIILTVYNGALTLPQTLQSIVVQLAKNMELVIVDDGSTDDTEAIIKHLLQPAPNIVYTKQAHGGVSSARNSGLQQARGRWITFVDSDDLLREQSLSRLLPLLQQD
ncbi:MAG: glycosyltransferase family 2 protein [Bacilli bacterium]